jgi:hypothetical protein
MPWQRRPPLVYRPAPAPLAQHPILETRRAAHACALQNSEHHRQFQVLVINEVAVLQQPR